MSSLLVLSYLTVSYLTVSTVGLGGVVPQYDFLDDVNSDMLDSMTSEMAHADYKNVAESCDKIAAQADAAVEHCQTAFSYVFNFIAKQEKGSGPSWRPTMTGLILTAAPIGKGVSMWVSEEGMEDFLLKGKDAVKEISLSPTEPPPGSLGSLDYRA